MEAEDSSAPGFAGVIWLKTALLAPLGVKLG